MSDKTKVDGAADDGEERFWKAMWFSLGRATQVFGIAMVAVGAFEMKTEILLAGLLPVMIGTVIERMNR